MFSVHSNRWKTGFFREEYVYMETVSQAEKRLTHTRRSNWKRSTHIHFVRHNYMIDVINYFGVLFCKTEANVLKAPRESLFRLALIVKYTSKMILTRENGKKAAFSLCWSLEPTVAALPLLFITMRTNKRNKTSLKLWICNGVFQVYGEIANVLSIHCLNMKEVKIMRREKNGLCKNFVPYSPGTRVCVCCVYSKASFGKVLKSPLNKKKSTKTGWYSWYLKPSPVFITRHT